MPANIPAELVDPPKLYLRDLKVGEECDVSFTAMRVDAKGRGFLDSSDYRTEKGFNTIHVRRDATGYHVTLEHPRRPHINLTFLRKSKYSFFTLPFQHWIPVESFTELEAK